MDIAFLDFRLTRQRQAESDFSAGFYMLAGFFSALKQALLSWSIFRQPVFRDFMLRKGNCAPARSRIAMTELFPYSRETKADRAD